MTHTTTWPLIAGLLLSSSLAQAGSAAGVARGNLQIQDEAGFSWNLDFAPILSIDAATGNLVVRTEVAALGVSDAQGYWSTSSNTSGLKVLTAQGKLLVPDTVVSWHSWVRADGTVGADTAGGTNPWRSSFNFFAAGNVDPDMSYGFTVRNNTPSTQTYTYTQGESLVPSVAGAYALYADIGGSVVNNITSGTPGLTLAPTASNGGKVQQVWLGNGITATANGGVGVGDALSTTTPGNTNYGTFATSNVGAGSYDYWEFRTQFTLTGGRDVASVTGYAELTSAVPELPSTLLMGLGLGLFATRIRRQGGR